jgi:hypothetical protein
MKRKAAPDKIFRQVKSIMNSVQKEQREELRDELLAFLLFGETNPETISAANESLKGLTREEKELIRKLADQTEALYRAHKAGNEDDTDQ